ncbi:lipoxygenase homology domain-containing protein 1-like isoform X1 [Biomphalaria glabrata]|uniref:Lipoxygenase homology domain-containing protein 1-like isoform X1 n=1 Tax=Biomphalaria glabrata TaxID=6526 RepID=A0A9W2ZZH7_BIOGL|nr:lipoxygenase homology domain-containing protein 1-like isoform X1 [Biomphalaria glabrata]
MEQSSIWAVRPKRIIHSGTNFNDEMLLSADVKHTWAGPINSKLYSESLNNLSKVTEANLARLERVRSAPQTVYYKTPDQIFMQSSWADYSHMFAPKSAIGRSNDGDSSSVSSVSGASNFCYLCSTLEEHRSHMKVPKKLKVNQQPRIKYIAPPPKVRTKMIEEEPVEKLDNVYRIVVWTGDQPGSTTDANVFVTIKGDKNILYKKRLCRGSVNNKFCFCQGSKEIFYLKSPTLGNLEFLTIEHDGEEERHSWYCEKIEVTCMKTHNKWIFICQNWLSRHKGDFLTSRDLVAGHLKNQIEEYEVVVNTGKKKFAGTDARVFVTFIGTEGRSPKIELTAARAGVKKDVTLFERNSEDRFKVKFRNVGEIKKLRIEHDNSGMAPGWFLNRVLVQNIRDPKEIYYFILDGWISKDVGEGLLYREINAKRDLAPEVKKAAKKPIIIQKGKEILYEVQVRTGNVKFAGTDANVYIIIEGTKGRTKKLILDDAKNNFEKGMTDKFKVKAFDTGSIKSIYIGHDNSGPGAGWFCEDVTVRKFLTEEEQNDFLRKLKLKTRPKDKHKKTLSQKLRARSSSRQRDDQSDTDSLSESDEDSVSVGSYKDVFNVDGKPVKTPLYEEYYFVCKNWIALDEKDGLLERELHPKSKSIHFQDLK